MTDIAVDFAPQQDCVESHTRASAETGNAQKPSTVSLVVFGLLFGFGLMGAVGAFAAFKGMSFAHFTRDPVSVMGGPAYIGFISNVGIVLWISAAAAALTGSLLAKQMDCDTVTRNFLLVTGLITLLLGLDDLFMLHEEILPRLGVPQKGILLAYLSLGVLYALLHYRQIVGGRVTLFLLAGLFLGTSLAIDFFFPFSDTEASLEDSAKLIGIVFWFLFVISNVTILRTSHPTSALTKRLA